jgi:hypothetical protein
VNAKSEKPKADPAASERADAEKPPEATVEPKPRRGGRAKATPDEKANG